MSVGTLPRVEGYDGSGRDSDWRQWSAEMDGAEDAVLRDHDRRLDFEDIGRRAILAGNESLAGLDPNFATDRLALRRRGLPPTIGRMALPPEIAA